MNVLILTPVQNTELEALNASGDPKRRLQAVQAADGSLVLNADLLEDCGPGQTWEHYARFLGGLPAGETAMAADASEM